MMDGKKEKEDTESEMGMGENNDGGAAAAAAAAAPVSKKKKKKKKWSADWCLVLEALAAAVVTLQSSRFKSVRAHASITLRNALLRDRHAFTLERWYRVCFLD
jgi:hypothetical protein